ncbi:MAG: hypothetical protein WHV66_03320 [Anaerolineales bacterium]
MKRPYTGYIRELFTYSTYLFRPKRNPRKKFIIFTFGRSGSNLLVSLLNAHPLIQCDNELLWKRVLFPWRYIQCREKLSMKDVYGFKLLSSHFELQKINDPQEFVNRLSFAGYQIISLKRRNSVRQAISHLYASYRGKFHHFVEQGEQNFVTMRLDPAKLGQELEWVDRLHALEDRVLQNLPYLRLYYEDDLCDASHQQLAVDRISAYLGIPSASIGTNLQKTTPDDLASIIENYDEIKSFIQGTKYAEFPL